MDMNKWLSVLPQFLVVLPSAASSYYTMKNQMRYTPLKTAALCMAVLLPYSFLCSCLCTMLPINVNAILLPSLILFFFLYRRTLTASLPKCLAVYVGVCAVQTFPAQFAYSFDAFLHPASGAADFSVEAAFFQLGLSCLVAAAFAWPACRLFFRIVDRLDIPKIWYSTVALSSIFLIMNVLVVPKSYSTLHAGRLSYLFPLLEVGALAVLTAIYLLFYRGTAVILEHTELKERTQLLEMQSHQYRALQDHMRQTAQLRHDFRHSVRLLSSLAEQGNIGSIRAHLAEFESILAENVPANYCANAALNALFGYYYEMAVSEGIDTDWHIELPEPLPATELDMVSLFGNLIENAIDGCRTVPEDRRYFCLTTEVRHGNRLYIVSTNSFDGRVQKGKDGYRSTKHSGNGIGLAAIAAVATNYGGSARASSSGMEFFVDVVLKI
ncbi:MAG: GHKL domain-containing protein [Lachnospiraceae bacterium]|nr:GHKL domain-containing protein [Lachnospiraceae bacterium]